MVGDAALAFLRPNNVSEVGPQQQNGGQVLTGLDAAGVRPLDGAGGRPRVGPVPRWRVAVKLLLAVALLLFLATLQLLQLELKVTEEVTNCFSTWRYFLLGNQMLRSPSCGALA